MSPRFKGGVVSATPPTITSPTGGEGGSASGIWSMANVVQEEGGSTWPKRIALKSIWSWGEAAYGRLGHGDTTDLSSPVQIGALTNWAKISMGAYHSVASKSDGTLWSWGQDTAYGALGHDNTTSLSSPAQVGSLTNWPTAAASYKISTGLENSFAIKQDGTLWAWGHNTQGELGDGSTTHRSSPVQIGSLTDWASLGVGSYTSNAIKTDSTLWSWGFNSGGILGHGDTTDRSSPTQVGSLTNWLYVTVGYVHTLAVKTDGTLWAWGQSGSGEVGDGAAETRNSPVQIGALTTWASVACGYDSSFAIKTDGTLWSWGNNNVGQLGQNNTTNYSSPVQVGSLTTWSKIGTSRLSSVAVKTDGTLWAWGEGAVGRVGDGGTTDRSSPVQIGALTTWLYPATMNAQGTSAFVSQEA